MANQAWDLIFLFVRFCHVLIFQIFAYIHTVSPTWTLALNTLRAMVSGKENLEIAKISLRPSKLPYFLIWEGKKTEHVFLE